MQRLPENLFTSRSVYKFFILFPRDPHVPLCSSACDLSQAMRDKGDVESTSFVRTIDCDGSTLSIKQLYVGTVGCVVWDAALVLCRFLENRAHFGSAYWARKRVLELGSGTGAVGLAAAVLG